MAGTRTKKNRIAGQHPPRNHSTIIIAHIFQIKHDKCHKLVNFPEPFATLSALDYVVVVVVKYYQRLLVSAVRPNQYACTHQFIAILVVYMPLWHVRFFCSPRARALAPSVRVPWADTE